MTRGDDTPRISPRISHREAVLGALRWGVGLSFAIPTTSLLMVVQAFVPSDRIDWLTRFYTRGQLRVLGCRVRYHVHPKVEPARVYMFCQNHINHLDNCTIYAGTPHYKQGLENEDHFRYPFYGWFMKQRGTIPVPREKAERMARIRDGMRREIDRGHSLLVFPEGTRTRTGRVGPFRAGVFLLARDLGVPVVPVSVVGMYEVMNPRSWLIHRGRPIDVYFDEPVETAGASDEKVAEIAAQLEATVRARVDAHYPG